MSSGVARRRRVKYEGEKIEVINEVRRQVNAIDTGKSRAEVGIVIRSERERYQQSTRKAAARPEVQHGGQRRRVAARERPQIESVHERDVHHTRSAGGEQDEYRETGRVITI